MQVEGLVLAITRRRGAPAAVQLRDDLLTWREPGHVGPDLGIVVFGDTLPPVKRHQGGLLARAMEKTTSLILPTCPYGTCHLAQTLFLMLARLGCSPAGCYPGNLEDPGRSNSP